MEDDLPRMVMSPWSNTEIPFEQAAEIGTHKVISEHSTVGIVVTTDGSFSEIPQADYVSAEERVISELKEINKLSLRFRFWWKFIRIGYLYCSQKIK